MKGLIDCALKRERCDFVLKNVKIFNVFTGNTEEGELAVKDGVIVGVGKGYAGETEYDGRGLTALPGFIDSHIHVESSMLCPEEFASLVSAHGTTAIVADPHEITNVCGVQGAEYIAEAFSRMNEGVLDVMLQLPSCVPASPFETSGATIGGKETEEELSRDLFFGLGEMMNYPGVLAGDKETVEKLSAAKDRNKVADGHAPSVTGDELNAYAVTGIKTDHECLTVEECREKVARGMYVQVRCGSTANNAAEVIKAVDGFNFRRFLLCSDDKNARDLCEKGHMDDALRQIVAGGLPAPYAVCMATRNAAECYGLKDTGALAPSYRADVVLVEDLKDFKVRAVFKAGKLVAENGKPRFNVGRYLPASVKSTVKIKAVKEEDFRLCVPSGRARAIVVYPHSIFTGEEIVSVKNSNGDLDLSGSGLLKLAVIERHFASGNIGLGLVKGFGLRGGAIGSTVAHDSHNLAVLGDDNRAMARVAALLEQAGGGMAVVTNGVEAVFPLDIAGLMSSLPAEEVVRQTAKLQELARGMGAKVEPFMALAFLSLPVIPKLKLTDRGLVDVEKFAFTSLEVK